MIVNPDGSFGEVFKNTFNKKELIPQEKLQELGMALVKKLEEKESPVRLNIQFQPLLGEYHVQITAPSGCDAYCIFHDGEQWTWSRLFFVQ